MMDKRTVLAFILSAGILFGWSFLYPPKIDETEKNSSLITNIDTMKTTVSEAEIKASDDVLKTEIPAGIIQNKAKEYIITVNDAKTSRVISSTKGVHFKEYFLNNYEHQTGVGVVSLMNEVQQNQFYPSIKLRDGREFDFNTIDFQPLDTTQLNITLSESNPKQSLKFVAVVEGKRIYQTLTFENNFYDFDVKYDFSEIQSELRGETVQFSWINGMPYTESIVYDDKNMSLMFIEGEDDYYRFDTAENEAQTLTDPEYIKNVTIRTKYFLSSVLFDNTSIKEIRAEQKVLKEIDDTEVLNYSYNFETPTNETTFKIYVGPFLDDEIELARYDKYDLSNINFNASGYEWLFSVFSKPVHKFIVFLNTYVGNFGLSILIFTIFIKLLLFPLTKKSYQGMKAMQTLKPKMDKIKEKYGDDPRMVQQKTMAMYKDEGINPLGGCLPMLLQMPLLMGLYQVFRGAIEFRGAEFLWVDNLAAPDALPIGILGIATVNVFPILMALSQIGMAKLQPSAPGADNMQQKMMQYMMPFMMLFMFYRFSAALNYYYFLFNVFTTLQQKLIHVPEKVVEVKEEVTPKGVKLNEKNTAVKTNKSKKSMYKKKDD
jgi:YidC/Oxa1 family membrane protein insertase